MLKTLAISLIICFSLVYGGCSTIRNRGRHQWNIPESPELKSVNSMTFREGDNVTFDYDVVVFDFESSSNLVYNINELNIYIEKLELLIHNMKKFYK